MFRVYPIIPEGIWTIDSVRWEEVESAFHAKKNVDLLLILLSLPLFPIKDSYVAYLRTDPKALERNPQTVNRICGRLYELGLTNLWTKCSQPKETNRQIGPMFQRWVKNGGLGIIPVSVDEFLSSNDNAVLDGSDRSLMHFAQKHLGYKRNKGLDLVARFNGKYVIAGAKFLLRTVGTRMLHLMMQ